MKIFVDSCVWRPWLYMMNHCNMEYDRNEAQSFNEIFKFSLKVPSKITFVYNERILQELDKSDLNELEKYPLQQIWENEFTSKIPIPLSRADGTYKFNGSLLSGGRVGGRLVKILGVGHEEKLKDAPPPKKEKNLAHTKPRKEEFDVEHLESALEAEVDLFITVDENTILKPLNSKYKDFPGDEILKKAWEISCKPTEALRRIQERMGSF